MRYMFEMIRSVGAAAAVLGVVWACTQAVEYEDRRTHAAAGKDCHEDLALAGDCPDWEVQTLPTDEGPCPFILRAGNRAIFSHKVEFQIPASAPAGTLEVAGQYCVYTATGMTGCLPEAWVKAQEIAFRAEAGSIESTIRRP